MAYDADLVILISLINGPGCYQLSIMEAERRLCTKVRISQVLIDARTVGLRLYCA